MYLVLKCLSVPHDFRTSEFRIHVGITVQKGRAASGVYPSRSAQPLPRLSLLSKCHTVSHYIRKRDFIYAYNKYGLHCADFHGTHKCSTALRADQIWTSNYKCRNFGEEFMYAATYGFGCVDIHKFTITQYVCTDEKTDEACIQANLIYAPTWSTPSNATPFTELQMPTALRATSYEPIIIKTRQNHTKQWQEFNYAPKQIKICYHCAEFQGR